MNIQTSKRDAEAKAGLIRSKTRLKITTHHKAATLRKYRTGRG